MYKRQIYKRAKIYWHAAGFGQDLEKFPERAEHFGITTLEAMAAGEVPLVYSAGGQKDIINNGKNGYLWKTQKQLLDQTLKLIGNTSLLSNFSNFAVKRAADFSVKSFYDKLEKIIS